MSYETEGQKACRTSPDAWQQIRDAQYEALCRKSEREINALKYEGRCLQEEEQRVIEELNQTKPNSFYTVLLSVCQGVIWMVIAGALFIAGYRMISAILPFVARFNDANHILAIMLAAGTALGLHFFLQHSAHVFSEAWFRRCAMFLGLLAVLLFLGGNYAANRLRGKAGAAQQALDAADKPVVSVEGVLARAEPNDKVTERFYKESERLGGFMSFSSGIGIELVAGLAFHEAWTRIWTALFTLMLHLKVKRIRQRLVRCASLIEWWKQEPEISREEFMSGAILAEGKLQQRKPLSQESKITLWIIALAVAFSALVFVFVGDAFSEETVVVALDVSDSSVKGEFEANLSAVENTIADLKPGSRFTVIALGKASFSRSLILDAHLTKDPGLFGERIQKGKRELIEIWRVKNKTLRPTDKESDAFGAVAKAAMIFRETPHLRPVLILISEMRHVSRAFNFENYARIEPMLIEDVAKAGLIHPLKDVKVWVFGAHAHGVTEVYWIGLRSFWEEYFKRSGAFLAMYTQNRRINHE